MLLVSDLRLDERDIAVGPSAYNALTNLAGTAEDDYAAN